MSLTTLAILIGIGAAVGLLFLRRSSDPAELDGFLKRGALVLDVRRPGEFRRRHAKDARNIPVDELQARISELGDPGPIVVYCASGIRSRRASSILESAGFEVLDVGRLTAFPPHSIEKQPNNAPV